ncbi:Pyrimidine-specific ribonucleoside hydrolase RihB [Candidatus Izimaplasma bacterium HR1]|jgi:inosine-uridine nucleoside N-ribohydrolase|uniref:nucleoside hydrolase n=1 Tax=Candidatus Izimoplasma sp. HR1 TaxID=1541959 RepID=UPI0004F84CEE|nr:Pyrimidine-specific ribonucleoside hydrolase RihB [Candidatus Izimaplasma bacterium HR1]
MRKIIIDTDPGTDDAVAIIAASKQKDFDILGITTVAGNKGIETTTRNALGLVKFCNIDCKVYRGAEVSMQPRYLRTEDDSCHGINGMGGVDLAYDMADLSDQHAVDFILETVRANPNEVELLVIGPVTNIALAIEKDLETMKKVKAIYSMGGGVHSGNMNPVAEFNYWFDGKATKMMFELGEFVELHMVGLNVTHPSYFSPNDFWFLKLEGGEIGQFIFDVEMNTMEALGFLESGVIGNTIHDLLTVMYMMDHSLLTTVHANVEVATEDFIGQTVVDTLGLNKEAKKNAYVGIDVDVRKYKENFIDLVFGEDTGLLFKKHVKS